jgi:ketosteroid isomerase-like protein
MLSAVEGKGGVMAHPNVELVRKGFDAFSKGDIDTLRALFDQDSVWHTPGRNSLSGDHRGVDAILGFFARTMELTGGTFRVELHDVLATTSMPSRCTWPAASARDEPWRTRACS